MHAHANVQDRTRAYMYTYRSQGRNGNKRHALSEMRDATFHIRTEAEARRLADTDGDGHPTDETVLFISTRRHSFTTVRLENE